MNWEIWLHIATITSPIIGAIAIAVALWVSHRSSRDAQRQIDVFMAAQAPKMLEAKEQYEKQLHHVDSQIAEVQQQLSIVDPFAGRGPLIEQYEKKSIKQGQMAQLQKLQKQREKIVKQIQLINSFLAKQIQP